MAMGRGGRPDKSLLRRRCDGRVRLNEFFGVVGGAGVRLYSLPLNDEIRLFEEPVPFFDLNHKKKLFKFF